MSWQINAVGTRAAVRARLIHARTDPKAYGFPTEMVQRAANFLLAEVEMMDRDGSGTLNGVRIEASGHADGTTRDLLILLRPQDILLEPGR